MKRGSGILLHITSLPSRFGIGDLGPDAYRFVDFLAGSRQKYWQILPLNPTDAVNHHSPYSCLSAFAGNEFLISPEFMARDGWLDPSDIKDVPEFSRNRVDYREVIAYKKKLFASAFHIARAKLPENAEYQSFCRSEKYWLDDFALFITAKHHLQDQSWTQWPERLRDRTSDDLREAKGKFSVEIERAKFLQFLFFRQWKELRDHCREKGVEIIGDIPIYVNHDSAEVWTNRHLFKLEPNGEPQVVAGVPPDYFSETGQRWGNPVYDWPQLKKDGYEWWIRRIAHNLELFDHVRVDHFRGFAAYWEIPAAEKTAVNGYWAEGPRDDFFKVLLGKFPTIPIIAEDLGIITQDVRDLMNHFNFPGMKILQFAFGDDMKNNPYLPHNYVQNCLVYTGTHDNNTTRGWFEHDAREEEKINVAAYLSKTVSSKTIHWDLVRLAMSSAADVAILPVQDVLGLGKQARMNVPGTLRGNWRWRLSAQSLKKTVVDELAALTSETQRI